MRLSPLVLALSLSASLGTAAPSPGAAAPAPVVQGVARPTLQSLVLTLDDGSALTLSGSQLGGENGGFIVWNSFGVTQIAMAYLAGRPDNTLAPEAIWNLWAPAAEAEAPVAFLVNGGTLTPLGAALPGVRNQRAKLVALTVTLSNGRSRTMPFKMLEDPINGVLVWGEASVRATLVPFYDSRPWLRANANTVLTKWNTQDAAGDLYATMTKPQCVPDGWP